MMEKNGENKEIEYLLRIQQLQAEKECLLQTIKILMEEKDVR